MHESADRGTGGESAGAQPRRPGALHARLRALVGTWSISGEQADTAPRGAGEPIGGHVTFEWLDGGVFLVQRGRMEFDGAHLESLWIIGPGEDGRYALHGFDSLGYQRRYEVHAEGELLRLTGPRERATYEPRGDTVEARWEYVVEGDWKPLCRFTLSKIEQRH